MDHNMDMDIEYIVSVWRKPPYWLQVRMYHAMAYKSI